MNSASCYYHYTSILRLALILKHETIRFSRADMVNDLEEINVADRPEIKKSTFISCWTTNHNESIPMWNLYGDNLRGVRMKLKTPIFEGASVPYVMADHGCKVVSFKNIENTIDRRNEPEWVKYLFGPIGVSYKKNTQVKVNGPGNSLIVKKIGTVKPKHWKFEKEVRFLALANHDWNDESKRFEAKEGSCYSEVVSEYFDIKIDKLILDDIEILMGPYCNEAEYIIVESLLKKYADNYTILESDLKEKIKY